mgnify:CR=1 FL=1
MRGGLRRERVSGVSGRPSVRSLPLAALTERLYITCVTIAHSQIPSALLFEFEGFEEGFEVALAEGL